MCMFFDHHKHVYIVHTYSRTRGPSDSQCVRQGSQRNWRNSRSWSRREGRGRNTRWLKNIAFCYIHSHVYVVESCTYDIHLHFVRVHRQPFIAENTHAHCPSTLLSWSTEMCAEALVLQGSSDIYCMPVNSCTCYKKFRMLIQHKRNPFRLFCAEGLHLSTFSLVDDGTRVHVYLYMCMYIHVCECMALSVLMVKSVTYNVGVIAAGVS